MNAEVTYRGSFEGVPRQSQDALTLVLILATASDTLADRARWTRGALARSPLCNAVLPVSDSAFSWSASGALAFALFQILGPAAAQCDRYRLYDLGIRLIWDNLPEDQPRTARLTLDIDGFNDYPGTDHQDVVELFDRALASARSTVC